MRKKIVAANWKMNTTVSEGVDLIKRICSGIERINTSQVEIVIAPPYTHLYPIGKLLVNCNAKLAAQNCNSRPNGAYTGEICIDMLASLNVSYTIIGHSERRIHFNEFDRTIARKASKLINMGIRPIFCCGENIEQYKESKQAVLIEEQITKGLFHLTADQIVKAVIAYEPVWAIGTGETATADYAQNMHKFIRGLLTNKYSEKVANKIQILYGGSCNEANCEELFSCPDIDGGLIGGASLKANSFLSIINSASR